MKTNPQYDGGWPGAPHLASEMWVPALTRHSIFLLPKTSAKSCVKPLRTQKSHEPTLDQQLTSEKYLA